LDVRSRTSRGFDIILAYPLPPFEKASNDDMRRHSLDKEASFSRRDFAIQASSAAALVSTGLAAMPSNANAIQPLLSETKMKFCLNTSTIHGEVIPIIEQVQIAQKAGYDAIEIWLRDVDKFVSGGGDVKDLKKRIADAGLTVESAIAFANWIVDDDQKRAKALEQAKREMETVVALGGKRIAAPPAGAQGADAPMINLDRAAERYRALLEVGREVGCVPQIEVWGFSKNLSKLSEVLYVASEAQHPDACILPDIYHLYKGGSNFDDLPFLAGHKIQVFHMNDYPEIVRDKITDADRVYPGDGIAPIKKALQAVIASGFSGVLSLELFNRSYWEQDPNVVAATGLKKMKAAVPNVS
jgi:2-keto-myo-inositol isomerase